MRENISERDALFEEWIEDMENEKTKRYLKERVMRQLDWYHNKSNAYKTKYQRWMTASIVLSGSIPVASVLADGGIGIKVFIAILGAGVTSINAFLSLQNYKDLWNIYRTNRELIISTLYLYFNNVGIFGKEMDQDGRDAMLINMCEKYIGQEVSIWKGIVK